MIAFTRVFIRTGYHLVLLLSCTYTNISAQSQDEEHIALAIEKLRIVMIQPDSAVLASLVSDGLEYVHSSGTVRDKRSEEHTSELQSQSNLVCRLLLEKKKPKADKPMPV